MHRLVGGCWWRPDNNAGIPQIQMTPFALHRAALAPLLHTGNAAPDAPDPHRQLADGGPAFATFLMRHGLAPLWNQAMTTQGKGTGPDGDRHAEIQRETYLCVATYLKQRAALHDIDGCFSRHGIRYAAMKGSHIREVAYADPALRPATDIDILVSHDDRLEALYILRDAGFRAHPEPGTISHEIRLCRDGVEADLHWDILRPGRAPRTLAAGMIERRLHRDGFWGLDDNDELLLLLVHPAFAKHVCGPGMTLLRVVDLMQWLRQRPVDWAALVDRLDENGLKTAAWTMLCWYRMLAGASLAIPDDAVTRLRPSPWRAAYLAAWLRHDLPTRLQAHPNLVRLGLTLMLHDRPTDAVRALWQRWRAHGARTHDLSLAEHE